MKTLATALAAAILLAASLSAPPTRTGARALLETLVLLRWGHGALGELPPQTCEGDARACERRGGR